LSFRVNGQIISDGLIARADDPDLSLSLIKKGRNKQFAPAYVKRPHARIHPQHSKVKYQTSALFFAKRMVLLDKRFCSGARWKAVKVFSSQHLLVCAVPTEGVCLFFIREKPER